MKASPQTPLNRGARCRAGKTLGSLGSLSEEKAAIFAHAEKSLVNGKDIGLTIDKVDAIGTIGKLSLGWAGSPE